jgi:membrane protease YdiL (CAAX protease family)
MSFPQPSLPVPEPQETQREPWGLSDVLLIAVVLVLTLLVFTIVALVIAASRNVDGISLQQLSRPDSRAVNALGNDVRINLPAQAAAYLVTLWAMAAIARRRYGMAFGRAIAWQWPAAIWPRYVLAGALLWLAVIALSRILPTPTAPLPIEQAFQSTAAAYALAIFGVTLGPLMEELFFRGMLYPALARRLGIAASIVITALLFALLHASQLGNSWSPLLIIFVVGVVLTLIRARSGSVAAATIAHATYNAALFTAIYFSTGHFHHLEQLAH